MRQRSGPPSWILLAKWCPHDQQIVPAASTAYKPSSNFLLPYCGLQRQDPTRPSERQSNPPLAVAEDPIAHTVLLHSPSTEPKLGQPTPQTGLSHSSEGKDTDSMILLAQEDTATLPERTYDASFPTLTFASAVLQAAPGHTAHTSKHQSTTAQRKQPVETSETNAPLPHPGSYLRNGALTTSKSFLPQAPLTNPVPTFSFPTAASSAKIPPAPQKGSQIPLAVAEAPIAHTVLLHSPSTEPKLGQPTPQTGLSHSSAGKDTDSMILLAQEDTATLPEKTYDATFPTLTFASAVLQAAPGHTAHTSKQQSTTAQWKQPAPHDGKPPMQTALPPKNSQKTHPSADSRLRQPNLRGSQRPASTSQLGQSQTPSVLTESAMSEVFHISYLSKNTNKTSLIRYCETKGRRCLGAEETAIHHRNPWRSFRVRLTVTDGRDTTLPENWPAGVTCSLSNVTHNDPPPQTWGSDLSQIATELSYFKTAAFAVDRCAPGTSEVDVTSFLLAKGVTALAVTSLPRRLKSGHTAFKVEVPLAVSGKLECASFWPKITYRRIRPTLPTQPLPIEPNSPLGTERASQNQPHKQDSQI